MGTLRRTLCLALPLLIVLVAGSSVFAQEAGTDQAKALLEEGQAQYEAMNFAAAKATLLRVDKKNLSEAEKQKLGSLLSQVDTAIRKQAAAMRAYQDADEALKKGDLAAAKKGYQTAVSSEFLREEMRQDAAAQLKLVNRRMGAKNAADAAEADNAPEDDAPAATSEDASASTAEDNKKSNTPPEDDSQTPRAIEQLEAESKKKAAEYMEQGEKALDNRNFEQAVDYLSRARALGADPDKTVRLLRMAEQSLRTYSEASALTRLEIYRRLQEQIARVEFQQDVSQARAALVEADNINDFDAAESSVANAQDVLERNKAYFSSDSYTKLQKETEQLLSRIEDRRQAWERQRVAEQMRQVDIAQERRSTIERRQRQEKLSKLRSQARELQAEHKYEQALDVLQQIIELDPDDQWARGQAELLENFASLRTERSLVMQRKREMKKQFLYIREEEIPWYDLIKYPKDWEELTIRRRGMEAAATTESEVNRETRQKLNKRIPQLNFDGIAFKDVIDFLRDVSGVNIYVKWTMLQNAGIDQDTEVTVNLRDITLEKALRTILDDIGGIVTPLSYIIDDGVIEISTAEDLRQNTVTRVYDIRDLIFRVPNFTGPRIDLDQTTVGTDTDDDDDDNGLFGNDDDDDDDDNNGEENMPSRSELIQGITEVITNTIDRDSWPDRGDTGAVEELHGQLIITQTPENHEKIQQLISQLREARALQISIETRFISVNTGFLNDIGMDLDVYFNIGSRLGSSESTDPWTGDTVPGTDGESGWGTGPAGSDNYTPIPVRNTAEDFGRALGRTTGVPGGIRVDNPALSLGGTFLDDVQVDFLLRATQAHQMTRTLTAPRLTLFNGQRAYVTVGEQQAYVAGYEPIVTENATAVQPIIGFVPSGTTMDVEATVSADRRYVTMTVRPQISQLDGAIPTIDTPSGPVGLPTVTVQDLQTTVNVPDGGTLLLGGQNRSGEVEREMGVPILSKIPVLNRLTTNRGKIRDESTLLILVRPKIIIQHEEEGRQFPSLDVGNLMEAPARTR
ncbi:MAG: hypothetical protein ACLFVU_02225 [Phycisphaerae bacterium]